MEERDNVSVKRAKWEVKGTREDLIYEGGGEREGDVNVT